MPSDFWYGLAPELALLGVVVIAMALEAMRVGARWSQGAFVGATVAALAVLYTQLGADYSAVLLDGELRVDRLAVAGKAVLLLCGFGVAAWFPGSVRGHKFWILAGASIVGGMLMLGAASFATLFIGIELLSLPAFALIVLGQGRTVASEGAFKYLVLSSVASAVLLFGASIGYGLTGTLRLDAFAGLFTTGGAQGQAALLLVLAGLFLKAAVFPFHAWAPDAYAAARLPVTAWMASVVKAAVVLAIVRIVGPSALGSAAVPVITALAIVSIVFGNLAALGQSRFRRLLAYSSVAHAGYMIFALLDVTGSRGADLLWYTAFYGLATVLACASFAVLCPGEDDTLERLDGQFGRRPVASILLALSMLSLAGMPPLPGFFAKLFVFRSVIASGHTIWAAVAFIGSFLGLAYYVGIALRLFRPSASPATAPAAERMRQRDESTA
ncbi:MAG: dehydrogenase subunit [Steroidobacteraceae bacterium]|nr:dehydrogenase subunit [Steroidobacteraceae bacterium]